MSADHRDVAARVAVLADITQRLRIAIDELARTFSSDSKAISFVQLDQARVARRSPGLAPIYRWRTLAYMNAHAKTRRIEARVPEQLAEAVAQRADQLGRSTSDVVREAVAREVATPIDERSRDFVSAWLEGRESAEGV